MDEKEIKMVEKIKNQYENKPAKISKINELKNLNKKVVNPAIIFAYIFGIVGTLILGTGMCLAMEVLGNIMWLGIVVGVIGIVFVSINYPIYKVILNKRKEKYSSEIIQRSNEILNEI